MGGVGETRMLHQNDELLKDEGPWGHLLRSDTVCHVSNFSWIY
jgi:hypothetical protein